MQYLILQEIFMKAVLLDAMLQLIINSKVGIFRNYVFNLIPSYLHNFVEKCFLFKNIMRELEN